jgi:hypothetical protein
MAEKERGVIANRTRADLAQKKAQDIIVGTGPICPRRLQRPSR